MVSCCTSCLGLPTLLDVAVSEDDLIDRVCGISMAGSKNMSWTIHVSLLDKLGEVDDSDVCWILIVTFFSVCNVDEV